MREHIQAIELGATLFVPASHPNLQSILSGEKYPQLRSMVIDFEDGLAAEERQESLKRVTKLLETLTPRKLLRFIRPLDPEMLQTLLQLKGIEKIDGFIFPKFSLENAKDYLSIIQDQSSQRINFMPSIEGSELFDIQKLYTLRELLTPHQEQLICIRFGAQDMLKQLRLKQSGSLYDMLVPSQVIANIISTFKPYGFEISAPVYPNFSNTDGFKKELTYELLNGLTSKTIIHPNQIQALNDLYQVTSKELDEATELLKRQDGVLNLNGVMGERQTQASWANEIKKRAKIYGIST